MLIWSRPSLPDEAGFTKCIRAPQIVQHAPDSDGAGITGRIYIRRQRVRFSHGLVNRIQIRVAASLTRAW